MTNRTETQRWSFSSTTIGAITLELKVPEGELTYNAQGEAPLPLGRVKDAFDTTILDSVPLPVADLSNLITLAYRHVVLGGKLHEDLTRAAVLEELVAAMKLINYNGTTQILKETTDSGVFDWAESKISFQRFVCGTHVETSYNTETLGGFGDPVRQGTWTVLTTNTANVLPAQEEWNNYVHALAGEDAPKAE